MVSIVNGAERLEESSGRVRQISLAMQVGEGGAVSQNIMDLQTALVPGQPHLTDSNVDIRPSFVIGDEFVSQSLCEPEEFEDNGGNKNIIIGICAMAKKSFSKPMLAILERLSRFEYLETCIFEEEVILKSPVEQWPVCEVFISFHSSGFLLDKAIEYVTLRKPIVVNDLEMQFVLQDRREVFKILKRENIPQPRYAILDRESPNFSEHEFVENDDSVEICGDVFQKPFVEKPISAEDHNIHIYFPVSVGGGCQKLFRKVESRSSVYCSDSRVRRTGSYIYEEFMQTDGTDVKVYTVGPDYVHAEARKSPALDGKVERDRNGKEVRYPVILSSKEKMIARKVSLAFKQTVCGFDLLRANGLSYVCDVNGFSFVKTSSKYYDDCAKVLGTMIMRALAPQLHIPWVLGAAPEDVPVVPTTSGSMMELRSVIAVIRHGDRTPKQKMKMEVRHIRFFQLFQRLGGYRTGQLKIKRPKQLQEILDIVRYLLHQNELGMNSIVEENKFKLEHLKLVLEMYGHFSGINRKVQLKYQQHGHQMSSSEDEEPPKPPTLLLIVKWGGELTPAGKTQAQDLGKAFRSLYPGGQGEYESPGLGILRLHSTYRHDLKIYASDEGRVQMTAAAFTKGFLALEGELPPILVQMVKCANTNGLLDNDGETSKYQQVIKEKLMTILNSDRDFTPEDCEQLNPTQSLSLVKAMENVKNPKTTCEQIYAMIKELVEKIRKLKAHVDPSAECKLYNGETWDLLLRRWAKLEKDFFLKTGLYDISKVPDIYDCIKYDLQHNQQTLNFDNSERLFNLSKALADIVIPQEYGITYEEKLHIAQNYCTPLLRKIHGDLNQVMSQDEGDETTRLDSRYSRDIATPHRFVRTRLYFTSESHIHSLLTILRYGDFLDDAQDPQWKKAREFISATAELNYMTQIVIMMYEDGSKTGPDRFHVELHFSPGAHSHATFKSDHGQPTSNWAYNKPEVSVPVLPRMQWNIKPYRPHMALASKQLSPHRYFSSLTSPLPLRGATPESSHEWNWDFGEESSDKSQPKIDEHCSATGEVTLHQTGHCLCRRAVFSKHRQFLIHTIISEKDKSFSTGDLRKRTVLEEPEWRLHAGVDDPGHMVREEEEVDLVREESNVSGSGEKMTHQSGQHECFNEVQHRGEQINPCDETASNEGECKQDDSDDVGENWCDSLLSPGCEQDCHQNVKGSRHEQDCHQNVKGSSHEQDCHQNVKGSRHEQDCHQNVKGSSEKPLRLGRRNSDPSEDELKQLKHRNTDCFKVKYSCDCRDSNTSDFTAEANQNYTSSSRLERKKDLLSHHNPHPHALCSVDVDKSSSIMSCAPCTKTEQTTHKDFSDSRLNSVPISIKRDVKSEVSRSQSWEEKSSQSLKNAKSSGEFTPTIGDQHYLTVQLPLLDAWSRYSYANIIAFTNPPSDQPNSVRATATPRTAIRSYTSASAPNLINKQLAIDEMLTMVPNMQALETLHNSLTMQHMSHFLERITHKKFVTPLSTPPTHNMSPIGSASPLLLCVNNLDKDDQVLGAAAQSFNSSTNSSAGPSTPTTTHSTHEDIAARLRQIMSDDRKTTETHCDT